MNDRLLLNPWYSHLKTILDVNAIHIIGAGGAGTWVALHLVLSDLIGTYTKLFIWDDDILENSNLNRIPTSYNRVGKNKSVELARMLHFLRPALDITPMPMKFDPKSCTQFSGITIIIDCTDNYNFQLELYEATKNSGNPIDYFKVGYDGSNAGAHRSVSKFSTEEETQGYHFEPSSSIVSSLAAISFFRLLLSGKKHVNIDLIETKHEE